MALLLHSSLLRSLPQTTPRSSNPASMTMTTLMMMMTMMMIEMMVTVEGEFEDDGRERQKAKPVARSDHVDTEAE